MVLVCLLGATVVPWGVVWCGVVWCDASSVWEVDD